jgi:hypothetical protein
MSGHKKTLFNPIVPLAKLRSMFEHIRTEAGYEPARWMMDEIYQTFDDPEGNFLEQFQTTGFDARCFELYLFAYFSRSGFSVDRRYANPDFLVSRNGLTVAVEATTINPSISGAIAKFGKKISDLSEEELREYLQHELPIRFGSPLFSKLKERYWEREHCRDLPFVLAIEAFHDQESLALSDSSLSQYLYGFNQLGALMQGGNLKISTSPIDAHLVGDKKIQSNFFSQPDTEHISAVMFTNSGTSTKFARMGYQHGIGCKIIDMTRTGYCFNPDPNAVDPTFFSYDLDEPPFVESWGQGLVVHHNPNCLYPVSKEFFIEAVQGYAEDGFFKSDHPSWYPIASKTLILHLGEAKKKLAEALPYRTPRLAVGAITKAEFQATCRFIVPDSNPIGEQHGWFSDETGAFLGVVIRDKTDNDWGFVVLARDQYFQFRAIKSESSFTTRDRARMELQLKIAELLSSSQRIFPQ